MALSDLQKPSIKKALTDQAEQVAPTPEPIVEPEAPPPKQEAEQFVDAMPAIDGPVWDREPTSFSEAVGAGFDQATLEANTHDRMRDIRREVVQDALDRLRMTRDQFTSDVTGPVRPVGRQAGAQRPATDSEILEQLHSGDHDPQLLAGVPRNNDELLEETRRRARVEYDQNAAALQNQPPGQGSAELIGRFGRGATDELAIASIAALPLSFGMTSARLTFGATIGRIGFEGGLNAGLEATSLPQQFAQADDLEIDDPNVGQQLLFAGVFGAGLQGVGEVGARALRFGNQRKHEKALAGQPHVSSPEDLAQQQSADTYWNTGELVPEKDGPYPDVNPKFDGEVLPGFRKMERDIGGKIRSIPVSKTFQRQVTSIVRQLGPEYDIKVTSGAQMSIEDARSLGARRNSRGQWALPNGLVLRTGSTRHDVDHNGHGNTADLVLVKDGKEITPASDPAEYERFIELAAPHFPGIGHYGGWLHLGGGSPVVWGPNGSASSVDPRFKSAYDRGRAGGKVVPRAEDDGNRFLDFIAEAEGTDLGRGYNETLAYGAYTGGDVELTQMTLGEVIELQGRMLNHPDNNFNSSAVGRYQITRSTLRDLMQNLNIPETALYDEAMQDRLARALLARRGSDAASLRLEWEGLKNRSDEDIAAALRGTSPTYSPFRSRRSTASSDNPVSGETRRLNARDVLTDATTFQTRVGGDQNGVTGRLSDQSDYDPTKAGNIAVWERENGDVVVVDGHQRLDLAARTDSPVIASVMREADGVTADKAREAASVANALEGSLSDADISQLSLQKANVASEVRIQAGDAPQSARDAISFAGTRISSQLDDVPDLEDAVLSAARRDPILASELAKAGNLFERKRNGTAANVIERAIPGARERGAFDGGDTGVNLRSDESEAVFDPEAAIGDVDPRTNFAIADDAVDILEDTIAVIPDLGRVAMDLDGTGEKTIAQHLEDYQKVKQFDEVLDSCSAGRLT